MLSLALVVTHIAVEYLGQGELRDVVLGWSKASSHDYDIVLGHSLAQCGGDGLSAVANR